MQARYWSLANDGRVVCELCPRRCRLREGQRGFCFVRQNLDGALHLTTYGRSSGFAVDPVEKKPLYHFLPGSTVLSFGTAGCNLGCKFCQNWHISTARSMDLLMDQAGPVQIANMARRAGCAGVAYTYNDPVIFAEYAMDTAAACREAGLANIAVTAGYIDSPAREDFFGAMDAANVDLKSFSEEFYRKITGGRLAVVQDTLRYLVHETQVFTEITTLLVPGLNDSDAELSRLAGWVAEELGPNVPLHFTAFHPAARLTDRPRTPVATLRRARALALKEGLRYVYTGNVPDAEGSATYCPTCGRAVIERAGFTVTGRHLEGDCCAWCHTGIVGKFS